MKITLISPKGSFLSNNLKFRSFWKSNKLLDNYRYYWSGVSNGLLIVAALTPDNFEIEFIDENIDFINFKKKYDLVAISTMTQQATRSYQIADRFRQKGIRVVIGGIHSTILPKEAKQHADSVIVGEAENLWPAFIEDFKKGKTRPFYEAREPFDLTKSPIPRYELLKDKNYKVIWIQSTRGCPYNCEFCVASNIYGSKYRYKKIEQVVNEIKLIKNLFGNIRIGFCDDNMFVNKNFSKSLLNTLIPLNIKWFTQTDISIGEDDNFLDLLRRSGCVLLFIGFESLSEENLISIERGGRKAKLLKNYKVYIEKIQSYGISVIGAFIVGLDKDDKSIFRKISDFIIESNLSAAQVTILTPYPGTQLRKRLLKERRIMSTDWNNYTCFDVNFYPKKISPLELQNGLLKIYKQVYSTEIGIKRADYFKNIFLESAESKIKILKESNL